MLKKFFPPFVFLVSIIVFSLGARPFAQSFPQPTMFNMPGYDYSEPNSCTACHFEMGAKGDHNLEAVGVKYDDNAKTFLITGNGWFASKHSRSNYGITQNTFCAKCHSPIEAKPEATFVKGVFHNTEQIPYGKVEGVVCASCHPTSASAKVLGTRVGIYKYGMDKTTPDAYKPIFPGHEDELCLNCHVQRHDTKNPAFKAMYEAGVKCIDCHMAQYGKTNNGQGTVEKRFHDYKVATNLPFSCGLSGSESGVACHTEFSVDATLKLIPYLKQQHKKWWPLNPGADATTSPEYMSAHAAAPAKLETAKDYYRFWQELESQSKN